jgi:indolepyruvate ferredoxin oxidoreductase
MEFGGWLLPVLKLLARGKRLRGTKLDPFSYTRERRMERRLIDDYEALLDLILADLDSDRLELADELAALPHAVRGFGPIKVAAVKRFYEERARNLERWNEQRGDRASARARASAA